MNHHADFQRFIFKSEPITLRFLRNRTARTGFVLRTNRTSVVNSLIRKESSGVSFEPEGRVCCLVATIGSRLALAKFIDFDLKSSLVNPGKAA
jgi:hypothetical protein